MEYSEGLIKRMIERWLSNIPNNQVDRNAFFREINAEDEEDAKIIMKSYIDEFDRIRNGNAIVEKDIEKYTSFLELKMEIDKHRPRKKHQNVTSELIDDGDLLYNENNLKILLGDDEEKCIKYGADAEGQFCISRKSGNLFNAYRIRNEYGHLVFYFVSDYDKPEDDPYSFAAIGVPEESSRMYQSGQYHLTNKYNNVSNFFYWDEIVKYIPKLKNLRHIFSPKPLTKDEVKIRAEIKSWRHNVENLYINSSYAHKQVYISLGNNIYTENMWKATPTDLQNKYANMGSDNVLDIINLLSNSQKKSFVRQRIMEFTEINKRYSIPVSYDESTNTIDFESTNPQYPDLISKLLPYKLINVSERAKNILDKLKTVSKSSDSTDETDDEINKKIKQIESNMRNLKFDFDNKTVKLNGMLDLQTITTGNTYSYFTTMMLSNYKYLIKNGWNVDEDVLYIIRWENRADMVSTIDGSFPEKYLNRMYKIEYNSTKRIYKLQSKIESGFPIHIMDLENNSIDPNTYIYIKKYALEPFLSIIKIPAKVLISILNTNISETSDNTYEIIFNRSGEIDIKFNDGKETYKKIPFNLSGLLKNGYLLSPILLAHAIINNDGFNNYPYPNLSVYKNSNLIDAINKYMVLSGLGYFENNILTFEKYDNINFYAIDHVIKNLKNSKNIKIILKNIDSGDNYKNVYNMPSNIVNRIDTTKFSNSELIKLFLEFNSETAYYDKNTKKLSIFSKDTRYLHFLIKRNKILKEVDPESYAFFPKEYLYINSDLDIFTRKKIFDKLNEDAIHYGQVSLDGNILTLKEDSYNIDFTPLQGYKHLKYKFINVSTYWVKEILIDKYNLVSNQVLEYIEITRNNGSKISDNTYSIYSVNYLPKLDVCSGEYKYKLQNWPTELSEFLILKPYVKLGAIDTKEYLKKMSGEYLEYNSSDKIITIKQFIYHINITDLIMFDDGNLMCSISDSSYEFLSSYDCMRLRNINFFKKSIVIKNFISINKDAMTYEKIDDNKYLITDIDLENFKIPDIFEYGNNNYFSLSKKAMKKVFDEFRYSSSLDIVNRIANSNLISRNSFLNYILKTNSDSLEFDFDTQKFTIDTSDNDYDKKYIIQNLSYKGSLLIPISEDSTFDLHISSHEWVPDGLPLTINGDIYIKYCSYDSKLNKLPKTMNNLIIDFSSFYQDEFSNYAPKTFNVKNDLIIYYMSNDVYRWALKSAIANLKFGFNVSGELYLHDKIYETIQKNEDINKSFFEKIPYNPKIITSEELKKRYNISIS